MVPTKHFKNDFNKWTSGNNTIDKMLDKYIEQIAKVVMEQYIQLGKTDNKLNLGRYNIQAHLIKLKRDDIIFEQS
ncbi:hypothetical protein Glove_203g62 [Diversispora epigaea]|uniref:Uncharacterized protein n=1 Tax=Diversispora epigaea TaxID=1348612 RepID=A0A397IJC2_9GLOM|nr:hypothetical protein Glove_203g62 [Diversispora epigaea]